MRSPASHVDTRLTYDDFVHFPDDGNRHQIIDGVHHMTPSPDVLYVASDQTEILTDKNVQGPPALVVEVLSHNTRKRDAQAKRRLFERAGVRDYWLVDPEPDTVQVLRLSPEGTLVRVAELSADDNETLTTPLLPGCAVALPDLFG